MSFKKINPKILNNDRNIQNNKIFRYKTKYVNDNNSNLFEQNPNNQSLANNDRILNSYNKKLFMTDENAKEYGEILINKISRNTKNLNDNMDNNNSFMTQPTKKQNQYNNNYLINSNLKNNDDDINNNIDNSMNSNNNNSLLKDMDIIYNSENQYSKTEYQQKLMKKSGHYVEFLNKKFDSKKDEIEEEKIKLLLSNKELIKRCEDLIEDNKMLNTALNERTTKLNQIIKENISLKTKNNQLKLGAKNNEQKIKFYEEEFQIFKNKNENYEKIIEEMKNRNKKSNENEYNKTYELVKNLENDFKNQIKEEILNIKKNLEEINIQSKTNNTNNLKTEDNNTQKIYSEIEILKEKNEKLNQQNKLIKIENEKLLNQNNIYHNQIDTYINQINDLSKIIKNKDTLINALKEKEIGVKNDEEHLNKNKQSSYLKKDDNNFYNENMKKLIDDNQKNKLQIESLNDKLKNFDIIQKEYNDLINKKSINNGDKDILDKEIIQLKENESKLKKENMELNKIINEFNEKLENVKIQNKNLIEEMKKKENEIEKLTKEINEKDRLYKTLKTEKITKIKEYEISFKKYKEELNGKNNIIKDLKIENDEKDKIINELNHKIREENIIKIEDKKHVESKFGDNNNIEEKTLIKNRKESPQKLIEAKICEKEKINNIENKKEEKEERRYMSSLRNRFLRKKEEEKKLKELENQANNNIKDIKLNNNEIKEEINKNETNKIIKEDKKEEHKALNEVIIEEKKEEKINHGNKLEEEKDEVKESIREMNRKKNYTHKPKIITKTKDLTMLEESKNTLELTTKEIINNEHNSNKENIDTTYYLYGIDRNDYFHIFDIINKKYEKIEISKINLDEKSSAFKKDYQYEGTIIYNTLKGIFILTGEKTDSLYYFNSQNRTISKICKFNSGHDNGNILYDDKNDILFVFGGKKVKSCEFYNFNEEKLYEMPELITDRANASFIISNDKIFGFFGFSYLNNKYANSIEYIDYNTKEKWFELSNINMLQKDITFDMESVATLYYKNNDDEIMIYNGIKGDDEDFITDYYLIYNIKNNSMNKIKSWDVKQFKSIGKRWKNYFLRKSDPQGFHFAKNTRFLNSNIIDGNLNYLIDYKNNVHFVYQDKEKIEIYRGNI